MPTKKQTQKSKQVFMTRTKSAIFVVAFYVLYALLLIFSNENWFPVLMDLDTNTMHNVQFTLNFFNVLMIIPIIYFIAKEITDLCFPGKKGVFIYTVIALFVLTMGVSIYLLGSRYNFFAMYEGPMQNSFTVFLLISLLGIVLFTIASTLVWVVMSRHIVYVGRKTRIWYPILVFVINTFFVGFVYTTIIHTWTTFVFLIILSTCSDVFAYIGGTKFGKHKITPKISPNKTWEGAIFGFACALVIYCGVIGLFFIPGAEEQAHSLYCFLGNQTCPDAVLGQPINLQPYYWGIYIPAGLLIVVVSFFGDIFFSFIKRRFSIKDFSNLIPGHGGILDRIDSLIFTFTFYFLITVILQLIMIGIGHDTTGLRFLWTGNPGNLLF